MPASTTAIVTIRRMSLNVELTATLVADLPPRPRRLGRSPDLRTLAPRLGSNFRHHGVLTTSAYSSEAPQRLQNFLVSTLPSPQSPQIRSPGLSRRDGGCRRTTATFLRDSCGSIASGCSGLASAVPV